MVVALVTATLAATPAQAVDESSGAEGERRQLPLKPPPDPSDPHRPVRTATPGLSGGAAPVPAASSLRPHEFVQQGDTPPPGHRQAPGVVGPPPDAELVTHRPKIPRIPVGTDDSELVQAPRARGEASVSQVEAKQIAIRRLPERQWVATADLAPWPRWLVRDPRPVEHRGPAFPPLPDRATRDTGLPRNLAVVTTGSDKLKDQHDFLARAHLRYPPRQARVAKRETLMAQTHLPERACGFDSRLGHPSPAT